ncbi:MAG TPA: ABC-F family ATP-binding cassette domain-containing protein [Pseudomonadales bacterium]
MSTLLQARGVTHDVGDRTLFTDLEFTVSDGARIGLVGHNGCGKSTLLDFLAAARAPDSGDIIAARGLKIGRVEQFLPPAISNLNVVDAVLERLPGAQTDQRWRAEALLAELGIAASVAALATGDLSGGQQNRLMFARAVIAEPELLLLDEPTNHLDLATLRVFESYLAGYRGAFVLVSHDRAFLDAVTDETWFLRDGRLWCFDLSFSDAREALAEADAAARRSREAEDRKIEAIRASAKRLAIWGRDFDNEKFAKRAKSMEKRADRLEAERTFVTRGSPLDLTLDMNSVKSKEVVRIERLDVAPLAAPEVVLFNVELLLLRPGERVALLGANGAGKSTFIRLLTSVFRGADAAGIRVSPQARLGYYDQELDEATSDSTLVDFITRRVDVVDDVVRRRLINAGFPYRDHDKRLADMSGGERARALFIVLSLKTPNFLILDEPTNHIDIEGKEQLEAQLLESAAAVLITSHDRRFIDTVAQRFLLIRGRRLFEISDPAEFYDTPESVELPRAAAPVAPPTANSANDDVLARIVELEAKLSADLARKPKFRKPELQQQWQAELDVLYRSLD